MKIIDEFYMKLIVYIRVSTGYQVESGHGLAVQRDDCQKWAKEEGFKINKIFSEEGVSGALRLDQRPQLMEAINFLSKDDILLVSKRDRLGRDVIQLAMIEASINRKGARLISVAGEGTVGEDPTSVLTRRMIDAFSEFERNITRERIRAALNAKKRRGERTGKVPYGKCLKEDGIHLKDCEEERKILYQIATLRNSGLSIRKIASDLNSRNILNRGSFWQHDSIFHKLKIIKEMKNSP